MSIENGEFDPNDPNCAAPAVEPCQDPDPPPGGPPAGEGGEGAVPPLPPQAPAPRSRFLGTLSGPRVMAQMDVIGRAVRAGFREVTMIPQFLYSSAKSMYLDSHINDYETLLYNIDRVPIPDGGSTDDLDILRIFLKKVWVQDSMNYGAAKKEYFQSVINSTKNVSLENYTPLPGHISNMKYSVTGKSFTLEPGVVDPGPEVFDSTSNTWSSQVNLGFDPDLDVVPYLTPTDQNQGLVLPASADWQKKTFKDDVFQSPLPFNRREMDWIVSPQFSMVTVKPVVNYFDETKTEKTVMHMKSLYRAYFGSITESPPECFEDDKIQKFSSDSIQQMRDANDALKNNYNQYVEISINTSQGSPITTLMDEYQMDKYFLNMAATPHYSEERVLIKDQTLFGYGAGDSSGQDLGNEFSRANWFGIQNIKIYSKPLYGDGQLSISNIKSRSLEFFQKQSYGQYPLRYQYWDSPEFLRFTDTIRSQIFLNKVEGQFLTKNHLRSFEDILNGEKSPSEVFGYKIQKHEVEDGVMNETPVQEFYFADSDKVLTIDFVDTQVVPGKTYTYRIYSLNLVFGSEYNYSNLADNHAPAGYPGIDGPCRLLRIPVNVAPLVSIIEAPFFEKTVIIEEKPPLSPQASFLPFKGVDDKMQILLNSNHGEREEHPIKVLESDEEIFEKMKQTQEDRSLFGDPLEYATDSIPKQFQIFRRSSPPEKYSDFAGSDYIKTIDTNFKTLIFVDDDNFEPNKDYYYMFRAIDRVGISNPSAVFKVRMVSYENGIFMDLKEYEMRPLERPIAEDMCFKRVLKIEPAFDQRALIFPGSDLESREFMSTAPLLNMTNVGIHDNTVTPEQMSTAEMIWGRRFKIRLTSKHSGKKIDLNVRFNLKHSERGKPDPTVDPDPICD